MIRERLEKLRQEMQENTIEYYIIPTGDYHLSEYDGEYFHAREYMSGFTGSAGTLVVGMKEAGLWTDGRYYIQAERQLKGSTITLYKQGSEGVPTVEEYLKSVLQKGENIGFDGKVMPAKMGCELESFVLEKGGNVLFDEDLVGKIWEDRPLLSQEPAFLLEEKYAGESVDSKLSFVRAVMKEKNADFYLLSMLDDISWLLNIRGNDVACTPVILAYAVVTEQSVYLFADMRKFSIGLMEYFADCGVEIMPYEDIYSWLKDLPGGYHVMFDRERINYALYKSLPSRVKKIDCENPTIDRKARKNPVEVKNLKQAHIKDGVAVTKFIYWLKKNIGKIPISELSAASYLEDCRREQEGYIEPSFDTISAYRSNAAMMHYSATPQSDVKLSPEGMLLVDSGGQYYEGTTDITRTIVLGPVSEEIRKQYTAVLRGMIRLADAKFLYGCTGLNLDILAREPLWEMGLDYRCGTGHGVGYLLSVHEAPNGFRWKTVSGRDDRAVLEEGMVTSDEPGVYVEGSHGIRIENELLCRKGEKNEYGQFMYFDTLTLVPIDLEAVDPQYMTQYEIEWLNLYHQKVYHMLAPHLNEEERVWLRMETREIGK